MLCIYSTNQEDNLLAARPVRLAGRTYTGLLELSCDQRTINLFIGYLYIFDTVISGMVDTHTQVTDDWRKNNYNRPTVGIESFRKGL